MRPTAVVAMRVLRPPGFWYRSPGRPGWISTALIPLALAWRTVARRRLRRGKRAAIGVPVICVGNVNVGGSGKTPTVIEIVSRLHASGQRPHVLSKGYGGSLRGPVLVDPATHTADQVGDEPLLHAAFAPTWVSRDRLSAGRAAAEAGATVVVMDDGFQNSDLNHDISIIVVNSATGFGNGRVIPSGPLREPVGDAVSRADLVVTIGSRMEHEPLMNEWPQLRGIPGVQGTVEVLPTGMDWAGQRVLAFAGIAHPRRFYETLRRLGTDVAATRSFPDHQIYGPALLKRLEREAVRINAQLVTTEKDAVRLPPSFRKRVLTVPIRLVIHDAAPLTGKFGEVLVGGKSPP